MSADNLISLIRAECNKRNMTDSDFADHIGYDKGSWSRVKTGQFKWIPKKHLQKIADFLGLPLQRVEIANNVLAENATRRSVYDESATKRGLQTPWLAGRGNLRAYRLTACGKHVDAEAFVEISATQGAEKMHDVMWAVIRMELAWLIDTLPSEEVDRVIKTKNFIIVDDCGYLLFDPRKDNPWLIEESQHARNQHEAKPRRRD